MMFNSFLILIVITITNVFSFNTPQNNIFVNRKKALLKKPIKLGGAVDSSENKFFDVGSFTHTKWACPIPYKLGSVLDTSRVETALNYLEQKTGWTFVKRTTQLDYIEFTNDNGCWSYVGKQGGRQEIGLSEYCDQGAVIHEIAHAIGLEHEQTRNDRDYYVDINFDNIEDAYESNFAKSSAYNWEDYDYGSIMHYGRWDFAEDESIMTITPTNDTNGVCYIGQRFELTDQDVIHLNNLIDGDSCSTNSYYCNSNNIKICGVDSDVNGLDLIFSEYELVGSKNGKNKYRSKWKFLNEYFVVYWTGIYWVIEFEYNSGQYAYSFSEDLFTATWYQYNFVTYTYDLDDDITITNVVCDGTPSPTVVPEPTTSPTLRPTSAPVPTTSPTPEPTYSIDCNVLNPSWIGDGYCDWDTPGYNTEDCDWDGGDCCPDCCTSDSYTCGINGYQCLDPNCQGEIVPTSSPTTRPTSSPTSRPTYNDNNDDGSKGKIIYIEYENDNCSGDNNKGKYSLNKCYKSNENSFLVTKNKKIIYINLYEDLNCQNLFGIIQENLDTCYVEEYAENYKSYKFKFEENDEKEFYEETWFLIVCIVLGVICVIPLVCGCIISIVMCIMGRSMFD